MNPIDDPLITNNEVCHIFGGVSKMTIWRWRKAGIIPPPLVINKRNYYRKSVINDVLSRVAGHSNGAFA